MEKEKILSTINERLEAEGIKTSPFQRSLNTYIDTNLPAEGTEPDEAYFKRHVDVLRSFSGQFNHDVASAVDEFKKSYVPPKPAEDPKPKNGDEDSIKALTEKINSLQAAIDAQNDKERVAEIIKKVTSDTSLKIGNQNLWRDSVAAVKIEKTDTPESVTSKAKTIYERKVKEYFGDGAAPYGSSGSAGSGGPSISPDEKKRRQDEFKKKMKSQGRL